MSSTLKNTFLLDFKFAREAFCIYLGRLYIVQEANGHFSGKDFLSLGGKKFAVKESETVSHLESIYFALNRESIEKFMSDLITTRFVNKLNESERRIIERSNYYSSMQDSSIESLLKIDVVNFYKEYVLGDLKKTTTSKEIDLSISKYDNSDVTHPTIDNLKSESNSLTALLKDGRILVIGNRCYNLVEISPGRDIPEHVIIDGQKYQPQRTYNIEEIEKKYLDNLVKKLEVKAVEHAQKLIPKIKQNTDQLNRLEKAIQATKKTDGENDFGSIGFTKKGNNLYEVYIRIEPYIIKREGMYFKFPGLKVGTDLEVKSNAVNITAPPRILASARYHHPFVHSNNTFCYKSGTKRWYYKGINFERFYAMNSEERKQIAAKAIALTLSEGWNVIHKGYHGDPVPIKHIPNDFLDQRIDLSAARRSGLRIFDNDKKPRRS